MLINDQEREFTSKAFQEFTMLHKIQIHYTTVGHHESNGMIERVHSTLTEQMRIFNEKYPTESVNDIIDIATIAYNHTIHSETNKTTFELLLGHTYARYI